MIYIGALISIQFIALTAYWLFKKYHAQAVLLFSGLAMLTLALILGFDIPELKNATGLKEFDLFKVIQEIFSEKGAGVGLMIMTIGGFSGLHEIKSKQVMLWYMFPCNRYPSSGSTPICSIASDPYRTTSVYLYPLGHGFGVIVSSIHLPRTGKPGSQ